MATKRHESAQKVWDNCELVRENARFGALMLLSFCATSCIFVATRQNEMHTPNAGDVWVGRHHNL